MVNTNAQQMPVQPLTIDFKKVIRTRTIMFDQEFDRMYCLDVVSALDKLIEYDKVMETPKQLLKVRFNIFSYGGQCDAFIALAHKIEQMQDMGYVVHTHNISMCASCGFMLSIMGDYKTANEYSRYLNHQISAGVMGTFGEMETTTEEVRRFQETFRRIVKKHCPNVSDEELDRPYVTNRDITYSAKEALEVGFIDAII
mgnify:FL=1